MTRSRPSFVKAAKPARLVKVRCLGPGREHTFLSPDPRKVRICTRCKGVRQPPANMVQVDGVVRVDRSNAKG